MKVFKTEKIVLFKAKQLSKVEPNKTFSKPKINYINKFFCYKEDLTKSFLNKKTQHFRIDRYDEFYQKQSKEQKEGRWTLKEHIQFLQAIAKFGVNWKKISDLIPSRTPTQIRSHAQKFYKKLKECKDTELGIDFTKKSINNINDMLFHIKSVNVNYNIVTVFLYLPEKCNPYKEQSKKDKVNININDIIYEDISKNCINNDEIMYDNNCNENFGEKEGNVGKNIINNNFNNIPINNNPINNIFINNLNFYNGLNYFDQLFQTYLNNSIN